MFNWSFRLGFPDLIMVRLIASNLICLELLTGLDVGLMALTSTLKTFRCSIYKMATVSEFFYCNKLKVMSDYIVKILRFMCFLVNCVGIRNWKILWPLVNAFLSILVIKGSYQMNEVRHDLCKNFDVLWIKRMIN